MVLNTTWDPVATETTGGKDYPKPHKIGTAAVAALSAETASIAHEAERESARLMPAGAEGGMLKAIAVRAEAMLSSRIEGVPSEMKNLCLAASDALSGEGDRKVRSNLNALIEALDHSGSITEEQIKSYHREILCDQVTAGLFRTLQDGDSYVNNMLNPRGSLVKAYMKDWLVFSKRHDIPTIVKIGISHAQFGLVHPFRDGNGRTSRVLIQRMMAESGWMPIPVSASYEAERSRYYESFKAYKYGNIDNLVLTHAKAVLSATSSLAEHQSHCERLLREWQEKSLEGRDRPFNLRKALDWIAGNFVFSRVSLAEAIGVSIRTAQRNLDILMETGVLECNKISSVITGKMEERYVAPDVFKIWKSITETAASNMHSHYSSLPMRVSLSLNEDELRENRHLRSY